MSQTVYESSKATFGYKYLFPIAWFAIFTVAIATTSAADDADTQQFGRAMLIMIPYAAIWVLWLAIRLKSVVATTEALTVRSRDGDQTIPYEQVDWVYEIAMMNPRMISLQHTDPRTLESKKILILLPLEATGRTLFGERPMTEFIRARVMEAKSGYSREAEPSRWLPSVVAFAASIPFLIVMVRFVGWPGLK